MGSIKGSKMISIMQKTLSVFAISSILFMSAGSASAAAPAKKPLLNKNSFSIGFGVSSNSVDSRFPVDDETGFQFFGAYDLAAINLMEGVDSAIEFGYMDYGFDGTDNDGIWATYTVDGAISGGFGWLARLGLDFGDDSGIMVGAGVSYSLSRQLDTRLEYVVRDDIDSIQLNFIYRL